MPTSPVNNLTQDQPITGRPVGGLFACQQRPHYNRDMMTGNTLEGRIKARARELGFSMAGITQAQPSPQLGAYLRWIKGGMHGTMAYMARPDRVIRREDLSVILPAARSLVVVGMEYHNASLSAALLNDPTRGRISNYAWGVDYHDLIEPRLRALCAFISEESGRESACKAYVDTGAILERSHAAQAGLGFTGKNTMLISPRHGSFFFIGEIITTAELEPDQPGQMPSCGTCTRCLNACPTAAFSEPYVLDARRCISYLTIEYKGFIPHELRDKMGNWVYGCDICQQVCPWQRFSQPVDANSPFRPSDPDRAAPPLARLLTLDEADFRAFFAGSAIPRIKRERMLRNACVASGNSSDQSLALPLTDLLTDPSPLLRGHAAWALGRLETGFDRLQQAHRRETDPKAQHEMALALANGSSHQSG